MKSKFTTAATVTKALRRDAGIITTQSYDRHGYRVRGGGDYAPTIHPDLFDTIDFSRDRLTAERLADTLAEKGWTVSAREDYVVVHSVPTLETQRRTGRV